MKPEDPILVTGAAGCIGAWVVARLIERGRRPIVFDLSEDRRRLQLLLDEAQVHSVPWLRGDLTDTAAVERAVADSGARAIIHLAALQVPFCKADPVGGARVNVVGHVNLFEAARRHGVQRLVYASSIAALPPEDGKTPATLYGVYKLADEGIARVYAQDWGLPSIGLRPHTVYGPARDQGLTSAPTKAMLAAAAGVPFTIPFSGALNFQYAGEVAEIFIRCAEVEIDARHSAVFDLQGTKATVADIVSRIRATVPSARIDISGTNLPFPAEFDDRPLRRLIGDWPAVSLDRGIDLSITAFRRLLARGLVAVEAA